MSMLNFEWKAWNAQFYWKIHVTFVNRAWKRYVLKCTRNYLLLPMRRTFMCTIWKRNCNRRSSWSKFIVYHVQLYRIVYQKYQKSRKKNSNAFKGKDLNCRKIRLGYHIMKFPFHVLLLVGNYLTKHYTSVVP